MTARRRLEWSMGAAGPVIEALASDEPRSWEDFAACAGTDPDAFFPAPGGSVKPAKRVCAVCPVREDCLAYALEHRINCGVWGGLSEQERHRLLSPAEHVPIAVAVAEKTCTSCSEIKSADEFWRNRAKADGLASWCIACHVEREPRRHRKAAA